MKVFALLLCLMILMPFAALSEEPALINRISDPDAPSPFAEDAKLLEIYFPKIYGVDAALVKYGDYAMLIDCAGMQWSAVTEMLDLAGVTKLTYALNTHPDGDHIGGFQHVLEKIPTDVFIYGFPEDYPDTDQVCHTVYDKLHELGIPMRRAVDGETLPFGDISVTVYQLQDESIPRVNNRSIIQMVRFGQRSILFAADLQKIGQRVFAEMGDAIDLDADILKYPHHGYAKLQDSFLRMVSPELTVITDMPIDPDVRAQLKAQGSSYALTPMGILRLATDGNVWLVERVK